MAKGRTSIRIYAEITNQEMDFLKSEAKTLSLTLSEATGKAIREWIKARQTLQLIEKGGAGGP